MAVIAEENFDLFLGLELLSLEDDRVLAQLDAGDRHLNGDVIHNGVIMAVAEAVAMRAAFGSLSPGFKAVTFETKTNFIRSCGPGILKIEAVPIHVGQAAMVWTTTIRDSQEQTIAVVSQSHLVIRDEARDRGSIDSAPAVRSNEVVAQEVEQTSSVAERRRAQILTAAAKVLSKKCFANATTREIAGAAGMPVPTMYQYFKSKDDILAAIFDDYLGCVEASMQLSMQSPSTATERLASAVRANIEGYDRHQTLVRMMNRETASLRRDVRVRVKNHLLGYIDLFRQVIQHGVESGEFECADPDLAANLIAMVCEVWPLRTWAVGDRGVKTVQDGIVNLVLHGITSPAKMAA